MSVTAQSTWKKSVASRVVAWARMNVRHASSRRTGGGIRFDRRILRMVEAAARWPSRRSSPWIRTTPHRRFSLARRRISAMTSSESDGRPGGFGWRQFAATILLCERRSVPGVTILCSRSAFGSTNADHRTSHRLSAPTRERTLDATWRAPAHTPDLIGYTRPRDTIQGGPVGSRGSAGGCAESAIHLGFAREPTLPCDSRQRSVRSRAKLPLHLCYTCVAEQ